MDENKSRCNGFVTGESERNSSLENTERERSPREYSHKLTTHPDTVDNSWEL